MIGKIKKTIKFIINGAPGCSISSNSYVQKPRRLINLDCISIGSNVNIGQHVVIFPIKKYMNQVFKPKINIRDNVYVGHYCQFHSINAITIGSGCVLSDYIYISDVAHGLSPSKGLIMEQPLNSKGEVIIGDNSFVGFGATILPNVTIGKYCIIGARSVVTKNVDDYTMVSGNPAKIIKRFNLETQLWENNYS